MKLTKIEQKRILNSLSAPNKARVKAHVRSKQMSGEGIMDILKSVKSVLGPVASALGPEVLKKFIVPMLKKQLGLGITLPGSGLRLAGQRGRGKKKKVKGKGCN